MIVYGILSNQVLLALYANAGSAIDSFPEFRAPELSIVKYDIPGVQPGDAVYCVKQNEKRQWFTSYQAASANSTDVTKYQIELITRAREKNHVYRCVLARNAQGNGIETRLNSHPERDGSVAKGRYFYPDKSWTTAREGLADVTICCEKERYGYLLGEMISVSAPTRKEMAQYLMTHWEPPVTSQTIQKIKTKYDSYFRIHDELEADVNYAVIDGSLQNFSEKLGGRVEWEAPLSEFLEWEAFGKNRDLVLKYLRQGKIPSDFFSCRDSMDVYRVLSVQENALLDKAIKDGLIIGYSNGKSSVFRFTDDPMVYCRYPLTEIKQMSECIVENNIKQKVF